MTMGFAPSLQCFWAHSVTSHMIQNFNFNRTITFHSTDKLLFEKHEKKSEISAK